MKPKVYAARHAAARWSSSAEMRRPGASLLTVLAFLEDLMVMATRRRSININRLQIHRRPSKPEWVAVSGREQRMGSIMIMDHGVIE